MVNKIDPIDEKFVESYELDDWEIDTSDGWVDITHIHKTIKYTVWEVKTTSYSLRCADDHIVMLDGYIECYVKDLSIGDILLTKNGKESVISIDELDIDEDEMYDLSIDSKEHTFYTNGILSHNSTISSIYLLWFILFHEDKTVAVMANKESLAIELLEKIKLSYRELPLWLQHGIVDDGWNKKKLSLENGSRILAAATSPNALTGYTINLLYLDEFGKVPQHVADDFIASVYPVISSGKTSKIIMISTPFGLNHFYNFWVGATRTDDNRNSFYPISVNWRDIPGRDDSFKRKIIKDIGISRWAQEFECRFLGTNSTLIDSDVLERTVYKIPVMSKWTGAFLVYEPPMRGAQYVLGVDTGKGTGRDYSVIQVIKIINQIQLEQVAVYRNNTIIPYDFAQVSVSIAQYYNNANMMVENNDVGITVCDRIWYDLQYENLINLDPKALGVRSTRATKKRANAYLKQYIEKKWLTICDEKTIYELSRYIEVRPGVFAAGYRDHDDLVTSLLWCMYYVKSEVFDGKRVDNCDIDDEYNVEMGEWENDGGIEFDDERPDRSNDRNKRDDDLDSGWEPSVIFD